MRSNRQKSIFLINKSCIMIILLVFLMAGLPATTANAYAGGNAVGFEGAGSVIKIDHTGVVGTQDACRDTKSVTAWARPMGPPPQAPDVGSLGIIAADAPVWYGISRGVVSSSGSPDFGKDRIWVFNWDVNNVIKAIGIPYEVGEWVHIALVHQGGFLSAYKNGMLVGTIASPTTGDRGCQRVAIGGKFTGPRTGFFRGEIDEVAFWRVGLDATTIRQWMYKEIDGTHPYWSSLGAYYSMLPGSGTTVTDDGPYDYFGTFFDWSVSGGHTPVWEASGAHAGPRFALDLDGINDYAAVPAAISMPSSLTLEATVNLGDATGAKWIAGESGGARLVTNGTTLEFYIHDGATLQGPATATITPNTWQHIAGVYNGSQLQVYVNGVPGTPFAFTGANQDIGGSFNIGSPDGATQFTHMLVDEVRLWNVARSEISIRENMFQTLAASEPGLVAYYRMDTRGTDILYDVVNPNNNGTLNGLTTGTATSAGATSITQSGAGWSPNQFAGMVLEVTAGAGAGQSREIVSNTDSTLTLSSEWLPNQNPANGSQFRIQYTRKSNAFNTWVGSDSTAWIGNGNWSMGSVPVSSENVGIYVHPLANTTTITSTMTVANMTVGVNGNLVVSSIGGLNVNGRLFNNGQMQQTRLANGSSNIAYFDTGDYGGLVLNPNGDSMGDTTVVIRGNQDCTTSAGDTVKRCFDISPNSNNPGTGKTVTFFFHQSEESGNACDSLVAYHFAGGVWSPLELDTTYDTDGRLCGTDPRSVRVRNVVSFSPFMLNQSAPTAIELVSFSGTTRTGSMVLVSALAIALALLGVVFWLRRRYQYPG
jgi:hypothetical protein